MHNCLIVGSGRSGTSLVAGLAHEAGYWCGPDLLEATPSNPMGYFESRVIEQLNEDILVSAIPLRRRWHVGPFARGRMGPAQRWLAEIPVDADLKPPPRLGEAIRRLAAREPFAFKDPRFCYTLGLWRPHLGAVRYVCVFRDPLVTAQSMLTDARNARYLRDLEVDSARALRVWVAMYRHVLGKHAGQGDWLFLHYDQLLDADGVARLAEFLEAPVTGESIDRGLRRSKRAGELPEEAATIYRELCRRAGFTAV